MTIRIIIQNYVQCVCVYLYMFYQKIINKRASSSTLIPMNIKPFKNLFSYNFCYQQHQHYTDISSIIQEPHVQTIETHLLAVRMFFRFCFILFYFSIKYKVLQQNACLTRNISRAKE